MDSRKTHHLLQQALENGLLPPEVAEHLDRAGTVRELAAHEVLFEEGEAGDALYLILDGSAEILRLADAEQRRYDVVGISERGMTLGEMAIFDGKPRSATVRALEPLVVLRLERATVDAWLKEGGERALALLVGLLRLQNLRLRHASQLVLVISEILRAVTTSEALGDVALRVVEGLVACVPQLVAGALCVFNELEEHARVVGSLGLTPAQAAVLEIERQGAAARMLHEAPGLLELAHLDADHPLQVAFGLGPRDALLAVPLRVGSRVVGYVVLLGRGHVLSRTDRLTIEAALAPLGSLILNHAYAAEEHARRTLEARRAGTAWSPRESRRGHRA